MNDIGVPLNLKTVLVTDRRRSTKSLTPAADITDADAVSAARAVEQIRQVEVALAARHSNVSVCFGVADWEGSHMVLVMKLLPNDGYAPHSASSSSLEEYLKPVIRD